MESSDPDDEPSDDQVQLARYYEQDVDWTSCDGTAERARRGAARLRGPRRHDHRALGAQGAGRQQEAAGRFPPGQPGRAGRLRRGLRRTRSPTSAPRSSRPSTSSGSTPRVGRSTPVQCVSDARLDAFVAADPDPDTKAETRRADALLAEFGEGCVEESGDLASHMSTEEAARDIDILRAVVGDAKLSYFGASYGTFLGATYADLFPTGSAGWCSTARSTRRCRLSTSTSCRPRASRPRCGRTSVTASTPARASSATPWTPEHGGSAGCSTRSRTSRYPPAAGGSPSATRCSASGRRSTTRTTGASSTPR